MTNLNLKEINATEKINLTALILVFCFPLFKFIFSFFTATSALAFNIVYLVICIIYLLPRMILWLINEREKRAYFANIRTKPEIILLICFLFWMTLSCFFSQNPQISFLGGDLNNLFEEGLIQFFAYACIFYFAYNLKQEKLQTLLLKFLIVLSFILGILTFIDPYGKIFPAFFDTYAYSSTFINSNHYGYFLCLAILISVGFSLFEENIYQKIFCIINSIMLTVQLLLNASFGPLLAVFVTLTILPFAHKIFKQKWSTWTFIPILIFVILASFVNNHQFYSDLYATILQLFGLLISTPNNNSYGTGRIALWKHSFYLISENPIFGIGLGNFKYDGIQNRPHNEYLQYMVNTGIIGGLLYLAAIITIFAKSIKNRKNTSTLSFILGGAIFCYLISAFFGNTMPHVMPFFVAILGMFVNSINQKNKVA